MMMGWFSVCLGFFCFVCFCFVFLFCFVFIAAWLVVFLNEAGCMHVRGCIVGLRIDK